MKTFSSYYEGEFLFLAPKYRGIVTELLRQFLPGQTVWAFGSRATGKYVWRFSDLDIAVEKSLPQGVRSDLLDALQESDLPIKVDFVELDSVDLAFAERIRRDFVPLQVGDAAAPVLPSVAA